METASRSKLGHLLIAKSMAEALLVTAVSVAFYLTTTNPYQHGSLDYADATTVSGWAVDDGHPWSRVEVQLYIDDRFITDQTAAEFRPDVRAAKRADDDWHGFVFKLLPLPPGEHEARVYAVHANSDRARRTLQLIGKPLRFRVEDPAKGAVQR
jgi:hypothetical protein